MRPSLQQRLAAAGVTPGAEPLEAWKRLRAAEGQHATVIDLYEMVARPRGLEPWELPAAERRELGRSIMPLVWPGFAPTTGSEEAREPIRVVDYDPSWPDCFEAWRDRIVASLGSHACRVEHVGSTSVPELPAKPIIDVQVSVDDVDDEAAYVPGLEAVGLQLRSRDDLHRFFRPFAGNPRDVHVHVCTTDSDWEHDHLLFRDLLRRDAAARAAYAEVKREAAVRWADDGVAYTDAKSEVILAILDAVPSLSRSRERSGR